MWRVEGRPQIERVLAATSLQRSKIEDCTYVLLDERAVTGLRIGIQPSRANTVDPSINDLHINLVNITGRRLVDLARIAMRQSQIETVTKFRILTVIKAFFDNEAFNRNMFASNRNNELILDFLRTHFLDLITPTVPN